MRRAANAMQSRSFACTSALVPVGLLACATVALSLRVPLIFGLPD